jgi:uncharacterized radical SAM protein YgiQ
MAFIPVSLQEAQRRGWSELDVIFVTGDAYVDHPSFGVPLLARLLESRGFRVGIIAQPDWRSVEPFTALGRPRLFFGVSAGAMDSMVAHYTPARKLRHDDAYTPGNRHGARPNRATIVYTARLKAAFKDVPVVLGGIEASLRRFAHYDYWEDRVRRSLLFDAKADLLVYGMGERPLLELAGRMARGEVLSDMTDIRGTAFIASVRSGRPLPDGCKEIPSFEAVAADKNAFGEAFRLIAGELNPWNAGVLAQRHGDRFLVCNPPSLPLSESEMDEVYQLPFAKAPHPSYGEPIPACIQIRASITSHRGCVGGCSFCAIAYHQGTIVQSRSQVSVVAEIERLAAMPWFDGTVTDVGGPSANMYGMKCGNLAAGEACRRSSCLFPEVCGNLRLGDRESAALLRKVRGIAKVAHVKVSSGVRHELFDRQREYFRELLAHHVGGLLKVAPEHFQDSVTARMGKPGRQVFERFLEHFRGESLRLGRKQFIVPYLMSGHPGCTMADMAETALTLKRLGLKVEQVQDFTPTPGTLSTCMYHTGMDPYTGEQVYVAKTDREKRLQKSLLLSGFREERRYVLEALKAIGREDLAAQLLGGVVSRGRQAEKTGGKAKGRTRR